MFQGIIIGIIATAAIVALIIATFLFGLDDKGTPWILRPFFYMFTDPTKFILLIIAVLIIAVVIAHR